MKASKTLRKFLPFLMILLILLLSTYPIPSYSIDNSIDAKINSYINDGKYQECVDYLDELIKAEPDNYYYYSRKGYVLIKFDKASDAIDCLTKADELKPNDDVILNNLSWAYNNLGKYTEALAYSNKSLEITPDDPITLCNKGNALRGLNRLKEALIEYDKALVSDPNSSEVLYGKGLTEYDLNDYTGSIETLTKYNTMVSNDADAYLYLGKSYYYTGDDENALTALDKAISLDPKNTSSFFFKGFCYNAENKYDDALQIFDSIIEMDPQDSEAYYQRGKSLYYLNNYKESINAIDKSIELDPNYSYSYCIKAKNYLKLKDFKAGLEAIEKAIDLDPKNSSAYDIEAKIYYAMNNINKASETIDLGIKLFPDYDGLFIDKASIFYDNNCYADCINFIENLFNKNKFNDDIDLRWYLAQSYSALNKHSVAIKIYEKLSKDFKDNDAIISDLGWEYYYTNDNTNAEKLGNKALLLNPKNTDAATLIKNIKYNRLGDNIKITDFVKANYLYLKSSKGFNTASKILRAKKNPTIDDIRNFLGAVVTNNDKFTYFIDPKYYSAFVNHENNTHIVTTNLKPGFKLIKIPAFGVNTGDETKKYLLSLKSTEDLTLVFDLRNNTGGLLFGANEILDLLLPKCTSSYLVYSDGYKYSYTSDSNYLKFKKIIIMVNENSASSSELLSLSLKKHLSNVTIIGHKTFGKGVGQETYENKNKKFIILLTSFNWYVENINISRSKITPDIIIKGSKDKDYFDYVK